MNNKTNNVTANFSNIPSDENEAFDFSKITITNRFMFPLVFSHKDIAKPFIEAALGIKIYDLSEPIQEKTVQVSPFYRSVRYDVFTKQLGKNGQELRSFDLEMQVADTRDLPRRARYYQSMCDSHDLHKGCLYNSLKEQYVIFICPEDIFGRGLATYSFRNIAAEDKTLELGDRTYKNFYIFNEYRKLDDNHPLKKYLEYFATNQPKKNDAETTRIHSQVAWYQSDKETQERYMTLEQEIQLAIQNERERAEKAESRANNAESRAEKAESRASNAESRAEKAESLADKYAAILKQHGLL